MQIWFRSIQWFGASMALSVIVVGQLVPEENLIAYLSSIGDHGTFRTYSRNIRLSSEIQPWVHEMCLVTSQTEKLSVFFT